MIALMLFIKASIIVAAAAGAVVLGGRRVSAASRHLVCTLAVCGLVALPVLSASLPGWPILLAPVPAAAMAEALNHTDTGRESRITRADASAQAPTAADHPSTTVGSRSLPTAVLPAAVPWAALALLIYVGGVGAGMARIAVDQLRAQRLVRQATELQDDAWQALLAECARRLGLRRHVRLLRSATHTMPMAVGIRTQAIVLPVTADAWPGDMRRAVLLHELAHVVRRDCLSQLAAVFARSVYWMHPGAWWLVRRLRLERELACDDLVIDAGADPHDYAGLLLHLGYTFRSCRSSAFATGMAAPHQLEIRMRALLDGARSRRALTRRVRLAVYVTALALIMPLSAASARAAAQTDAPQEPRSLAGMRAGQLSRLLSADYWRQTIAQQVRRLADQLNYLGEMRALGYSSADPDVLFRLRQHGVTPDVVRALAAEGLGQLSADDLLTAVTRGVSAEYVSDLRAVGFGSLDLATLVRMRSRGINADFIQAIDDLGYDWSLDDLTRARAHGVDPDFIEAFAALGYAQLSLDRLVLLRSRGVGPSYVARFQELGYAGLTPEQLAMLTGRGISPRRVKAANEQAQTRLTLDQLMALASRGWKN